MGVIMTLKQILKLKNKKNIFQEYLNKQDKFGCFLHREKQGVGIPIVIKDNILVKNMPCTAGSKVLENYIAPYDATVIKKLKKAGFAVLGKTNMDEFAMGSSTENSAYQKTLNPNDVSRVPGGSSGGSAAAVAADLAPCALGSDTGGSIRQPASFCGVVGLKPTYGAVSRYGLIAMASSLDQIGPITKTVEDAKILFDIIKGYDSLDSTSIDNSKLQTPNSKLKIGLPKEYFSKGLDLEIDKLIKKAIAKFNIQEVSLPHTKHALACYYLIMPAEVSANLARYDGIRYGQSRESFGPEVRRRIMLGTYVLSHGYYDAYYLQAQKTRTLIIQDFEKAFEKIDVLITPTSPTTAFQFGEKTQDPLQMYLSDIYTVPVNLAGLPAISIPVGKINGLPVGLQIVGRHFEEETIFKIAYELERNCQSNY
ncbi:MAG: Asp-tRNA(Asn)/Glu-tRNA(Gln) amidotransferase GatCAB subunit A [Candidatus Portnoybacteria bacterium CG23_combo_of_CG06-09_8_20_14_all_37_13]|uniref:Glutamyl-tRNA(Gln) amidotransferase subunit A n=1 Tax=Candidatus Portnoybacteria bacterium CG23_combo_of_CG06-09_8_20_14_all_37_13 TaxID=1974819 RepID=A0A2G9YCB4_9BACT|nr:MAG: Asp-tRNA(Asn)/Glu-tRNA(Gln) amidotransferase GatCAB subunit A [Candidatus Portnoybacteria bacterium CG23_combo_of_CG06-09_8_20_14_all_37_13]